MISPSQVEVTLAERDCGLMLDRVENEVDYGLGGQEQEKRSLARSRLAKVKVRVHPCGVRSRRHHPLARRYDRCGPMMVVVEPRGDGVRSAVDGRIPMREAVSDLGQEHGDAQD